MTDTAQMDWARAADTLRAWALDESLKQRVLAEPAMSELARRVAQRYTAGSTVDSAVEAARRSMARGHRVSLEYMGESVRDVAVADAETDVFLDAIAAIEREGMPSTVSFDLSHVGSVIDPALGLRNARRMAEASAPTGIAMMISAEGSDRTDLVLDLYDALAADFPHVGITMQARLKRTPADLERVMRHRGVIRLVKGAFLESPEAAFAREGAELHDLYLDLAQTLIDSGHPVSVATHDPSLLGDIRAMLPADGHREHVEFEMLLGLGTDLLDGLRENGYRTREYIVFGDEWWLYVLNRIAEDPSRLFGAIADLRHVV